MLFLERPERRIQRTFPVLVERAIMTDTRLSIPRLNVVRCFRGHSLLKARATHNEAARESVAGDPEQRRD
ncbi:hypothetical protein [Rhodoblastus acidophilus]|uniref:hypothetical protein n=1 Tax=Rhodoblastus acidophilus TaxID=1074 RepID=UPI000B5129AB|nr:hypothetical protein [Rhodoblastus acidophilus]PPQ34824.1 hypothetical protein CKO16_21790 [Rhodoblastus acidophilus]RAI16598.1 hypothetical protein CH337_20505 [Rhodoblastus acidophilus]